MINFVLPIRGQYLPKDGAKLNYNQIYFEYPYYENVSFYKLYLAFDSVESKTNFKTCLNNIYIDKTPAIRVTGLTFGEKYKWYVETNLKSGEKINSDIHYFSLLATVYTDTSLYKRKITYKYPKNRGNGVIWCDLSHCAFDRNGNLVWFMPTENIEYTESTRVRDIKFENDGTITFIKNPNAIHSKMNLEEIWRAPLTGENYLKFKNGYHHSFQRLKNGNYMALAYDYVELEKTDKNDTATNNVELLNLIEFNKQKDIVWIWEMREHFPLDILAIPKEHNRSIINPHANSFSIDKENKYVYVGYRDISRVIKINRQSKNIEASYGKKLNEADSLVSITPFFERQHDAKILANDNIMIINNNDVMAGKISSLEVFDQPTSKSKNVKRVWNFNFNFDSINNGKSLKFGNVKILDNGNYLVNTGSGNRIFEITKSKKIVWDMMLFILDFKEKKWVNMGPYKVDYSTSLYPYYFSLSKPKITEKNISITIYNEGDHKDYYQCDLYDEKGQNVIESINTSIVGINNKISVKFKTEKLNKFKIKIRSIESAIVKELTF